MPRYVALLRGINLGSRSKVAMADDGLGRSELATQLARSSAQAAARTTRNWATVTRLMAMLDSVA